MAHTWIMDLDLHRTAIMYNTNSVNYAVSLFHDARHSLSLKYGRDMLFVKIQCGTKIIALVEDYCRS